MIFFSLITLTPPPPHPDKPPAVPDFGPFQVRFGPFRVRFGPFRVCFGVLGGVRVGGFYKGKEYHCAKETNANAHFRGCFGISQSEEAMGGGKKRGVENLTNDTPPKKGFWTPPRTVRFPPPSFASALFPVQKSATEQTRSSFGRVQEFSGERVLWYVFLPPYVLHPPISRPNPTIIISGCGFLENPKNVFPLRHQHLEFALFFFL